MRAGDTLSDRARDRLSTVFDTDDATGKLQAAWLVKEQLRALLTTGSLADAAAAKGRLQVLVERAAQPETNRLWRTVCRWWKEIEVLIVTGATPAKVEANNIAIKHIKRTGRGFTTARNYKTRILLRSARQNSGMNILTAEHSPQTVKSRFVGKVRGEHGAGKQDAPKRFHGKNHTLEPDVNKGSVAGDCCAICCYGYGLIAGLSNLLGERTDGALHGLQAPLGLYNHVLPVIHIHCVGKGFERAEGAICVDGEFEHEAAFFSIDIFPYAKCPTHNSPRSN
ncbi:transposase [Pseudarthrobacter oxydans]